MKGIIPLGLLAVISTGFDGDTRDKDLKIHFLELRVEQLEMDLEIETNLREHYQDRARDLATTHRKELQDREELCADRMNRLAETKAGVECWAAKMQCETDREEEKKMFRWSLKSKGCSDREATKETKKVEDLLEEREKEALDE